VSTEERPGPAAAPGRIALRSPLEAFLWIFITRLIALVTASRVALPAADPADPADPADDADAPGSVDPARARRVSASRPSAGPVPADAEPSGAADRPAGRPHAASRAVAVTTAASLVAGAAAFAAGRRRGRR
jgi:hypothetical protein